MSDNLLIGKSMVKLLKIAVAGKGGVGKTFVAGTLSRFLSRDGFRVLAVDADPAMNLAYALGIPSDVASRIVPITENKSLIEERTGAKPGSHFSGFISLTPTVDDIAEKYGVTGPDGVRLLVMGTIRSGGSGCMCSANSLTRALVRHITLTSGEVVVMDMEAGLEHLGRATAKGFDALLCVVEPGAQSVETAGRIRLLAEDINIEQVLTVGNKIMSEDDEGFLTDSLGKIGLDLVCMIPFDQNIIRADAQRVAPLDHSPSSPAVTAVKKLEEMLKNMYG